MPDKQQPDELTPDQQPQGIQTPSWQKPYAAYLFDLDGTLVDTVPDINRALNHCLKDANLPEVPETLTRHWIGHGARVLVEQALAHHQIPDDEARVDAMHAVFLEFYQEHNADVSQPYPEVIRTLEALRAKDVTLCVVSNKLEHFCRSILEQLDMTKYFTQIIGGDTAALPKPDPAPIELCLSRIGCNKEDALYVGDSATDVNAARNAQVAVVCVRDGYNHGTPANELGADGVIDTFLELIS